MMRARDIRGPLGGPFSAFGFAGFGTDFEATEEFENNDANRDQSTIMKELTLMLTAPANEDFDWLDEIELFVEAEDLDRIRVASATISNGVDVVTLDIDDVELAPDIRAPAVSFTIEGASFTPAQDHTVRADLLFEVVAGPGSPL